VAIDVEADDEARRERALRERNQMLQRLNELYGEGSRAVKSSPIPVPTPQPRKSKSPPTLTLESYVSVSVIEKEAMASDSQKGRDVGLPRETPPPSDLCTQGRGTGGGEKEKEE